MEESVIPSHAPRSLLYALLCLIATIFIALLTARSFSELKPVPSAPPGVSLPIGEQNRNELLELNGYYPRTTEPYVIKSDVTVGSIPQTAWCREALAYEQEFALWCTWPTPNEYVRFASARIIVPVPTADGVEQWTYDRINLQAVPVMQGWWSYNSNTLTITFILGLCAATSALITVIFISVARADLAELRRLKQA